MRPKLREFALFALVVVVIDAVILLSVLALALLPEGAVFQHEAGYYLRN